MALDIWASGSRVSSVEMDGTVTAFAPDAGPEEDPPGLLGPNPL